MKFCRYILTVLTAFALWSCTIPFDLDLDDDPVIFLESFPGLDDCVSFRIKPAYSKSNSAKYPEFDPQIVFTVNGKEISVYPYEGEGKDVPDYIADYKAVPRDKMRVEVTCEGFESIYAETVIPDAFPQRKIDYRKEDLGDRELNVIYVIPDNDPQKFFAYGVQIFEEETNHLPDTTLVTSRSYTGNQITDYYDMAPRSLEGMKVDLGGNTMAVWKAGSYAGYNDKFLMALDGYSFNGQDTFSLLYVHDGERYIYDDYGNQTGTYTYSSRSKLRLFSLSEEFYKYAVAQELIGDNADFVAGLAPSNFCYSNVIGGYGAFAGVSCVETDWLTEEFIENNR